MNQMNKGAPLTTTADAPIAIEGAPATGNRFVALLAGLGIALSCAIVWAVITAQSGLQVGYLAIGVGLLVGLGVRRFGGGNTQGFATIGAFCALVGCLLGNLFSACSVYGGKHGISTILIVAQVMDQPDMGARLMQEQFSPMDLVFYAVAIFEGYKLARRRRW